MIATLVNFVRDKERGGVILDSNMPTTSDAVSDKIYRVPSGSGKNSPSPSSKLLSVLETNTLSSLVLGSGLFLTERDSCGYPC